MSSNKKNEQCEADLDVTYDELATALQDSVSIIERKNYQIVDMQGQIEIKDYMLNTIKTDYITLEGELMLYKPKSDKTKKGGLKKFLQAVGNSDKVTEEYKQQSRKMIEKAKQDALAQWKVSRK